MENKFDAVIIGWGKGGKTLAADLAGRGLKVAIIEKSDKMYGGTCINIGCIPTKSFVHLAKIASIKNPATFEEKSAQYLKSLETKNNIIDGLRKKNFDMLNNLPNVTVFNGKASFLSPKEISIDSKDGQKIITGDKIFINTGANTVLPPIEGIKDNPKVFTSTSILEIPYLPRHLAIIGGGYIGLEFAGIFNTFGSKVTVFETFDKLLPRDDKDVVAELRKILESKGIEFHLGVKIDSIYKATVNYTNSDGKTEKLDADAILLATGRAPSTSDLNLNAAGVKTDPRGAVIVDETLKTTAPDIWALGDVKGGAQFTYVSLDDYRIVRENLFNKGSRTTKDREPILYSMFTDPPFSHIGLTEEAAKAQGYDVKTKTLAVASIPRAKILLDASGIMKAVVDAKTGKILGCTLLAPESSEVINIVALAMKAGLPYTYLRDFVYTHPSMAESLNDLFNIK